MKNGKTTALLILSLLIMTSCQDKKKHSINKEGGTAIITTPTEKAYKFSNATGGKTILLQGPNAEGLYKMNMVFTEVQPTRSLSFLGYIKKGKGRYHSLGDETGSSKDGFVSGTLKWVSDEGESSIYSDSPLIAGDNPAEITLEIESFEDKAIRGSFSGSLYDENGGKATLKDGQFLLKTKEGE